jgi:CBS domain-containing protein
MLTIEQVMNPNVLTVEKDGTFSEVITLMKERGIGTVPVVDENKVLGIVTRDDVLFKQEKAPLPPVIAFWEVFIVLPHSEEFKERLKRFTSLKVIDIMETEFLISHKNDTVETVVTKMLDQNYNCTLVVDDEEKLVGIVTKSDLIKKCY